MDFTTALDMALKGAILCRSVPDRDNRELDILMRISVGARAPTIIIGLRRYGSELILWGDPTITLEDIVATDWEVECEASYT